MSDTPKTDAVIAFAPHYPGSPYQERIHKLCAELERENAALRDDKARLDWLDARPYERTEQARLLYPIVPSCPGPGTIRAAIDAARKEAQP